MPGPESGPFGPDVSSDEGIDEFESLSAEEQEKIIDTLQIEAKKVNELLNKNKERLDVLRIAAEVARDSGDAESADNLQKEYNDLWNEILGEADTLREKFTTTAPKITEATQQLGEKSVVDIDADPQDVYYTADILAARNNWPRLTTKQPEAAEGYLDSIGFVMGETGKENNSCIALFTHNSSSHRANYSGPQNPTVAIVEKGKKRTRITEQRERTVVIPDKTEGKTDIE